MTSTVAGIDGRASAAYVGILTPGSTSRMRAEWLRRLTPGWTWTWIDTGASMESRHRLWRSMAYRYHVGEAVDAINRKVLDQLPSDLDLIWVDKGVFLRSETVSRAREVTKRLVHFTPDTAFGANSSRHFESTLAMFDLAVTTKSFEVEAYKERTDPAKVFLTTQGFDPEVHYSHSTPQERRREAVFIGLAEPDREHCLEILIEAGVAVRLAGRGWGSFVARFAGHPLFAFEGEDCFGEDYARLLSGSWIGLGMISKRFPELHTTRTFEIPACGSILATETTPETKSFFAPDEALFFDSYQDLTHKARKLLARDDTELATLAERGRRRVTSDARDYPAILAAVLNHPRVTP